MSSDQKSKSRRGFLERSLGQVEVLGNKLPDPAILFLIGLLAVWLLSAVLSRVTFSELDPQGAPIVINNLLTGTAIATFLTRMVEIFTGFHPLGVVLVAILGVGVAEKSGFIDVVMKWILKRTPSFLLTPMVVFVGVMSSITTDAGYVLVVPLGGRIFHSAGRHPLAGIAAAFAGVSAGFSANLLPTGLDPLLAGLTSEAAGVIEEGFAVNPLNNYYFMIVSTVLLTVLGWFVTARITERRLKGTEVDGDGSIEGQLEDIDPALAAKVAELESQDSEKFGEMTPRERRAMWAALGSMLLFALIIFFWALPEGSALREPESGSLTSYRPMAPLMGSIVPLIFLLFIIPGTVYGIVSKKFKSSEDAVKAMTKSMETMGYYLVMAFFAALFIDAFRTSNIGILLVVKGANFLESAGAPDTLTLLGLMVLVALVNLLVGSATAKWALIGPVLVPLLMLRGISPDLTQVAYRVSDSCTNIITPMMPYFPLVVVFARKYVKKSGIGTITAMMLPYSIVFMVVWTGLLMLYWKVGLPLGLQAVYDYIPLGK
jgi:aminobenzoyl-glutamate transport protein